MTSRILSGLALAALVTACNPKAADNSAAPTANATAAVDSKDPIASAEAAAPAAIAKDAGIMTVGADGKPTMVRESKNGWTCMPDSPTTPGPDAMCMDAAAMKWAGAWMGHQPPPEGIGIIYMLAGGTDASNTDPYATAPTAGSDWVRTGPHMMIVGAPALNAQYKGEPSPDTKVPYVMWAGTPYAHLMVPTN